ncbi:hypothetical protein AVEN_204221-1 [Araneus ventricosus]|uniref:Uncharacterized protein n=1 Tax=Araneus ventricosus TaxID=182803 RepID=A0A4Y2SX68_ARAVE|nr:hypothetical protein AVEN_14716-1 [Araneus ventricosus]GBN92933.1 hypothetical protein AVEN_204221-1 [Araneus ventricosus]
MKGEFYRIHDSLKAFSDYLKLHNVNECQIPISKDALFQVKMSLSFNNRIHYCYKAKTPHDQYLFTGVEEIRRLREEQACDNRQNAVVTGKMLLYQESSQVLEHMAVVGSQIGEIGGMVKRLSGAPEVLQQLLCAQHRMKAIVVIEQHNASTTHHMCLVLTRLPSVPAPEKVPVWQHFS